MSKNSYDQLLSMLNESFDRPLDEREKRMLENALRENPGLLKEKENLCKLRRMITESRFPHFSPGFAGRVMDRLRRTENREEWFFGSILWSFRRLAIAGAVSIVLLAAVNTYRHGEFSLRSLLSMPEVTLEDTITMGTIIEE